jgi:glutathione synthase/RimK-type ligase-like ATP-grasp enzyme
MDDPCDYAVIIDRISHEVPFYRAYLKQAALQGTTVVNNPFMWSADNKFFEASLATKLGIASPKTVLLPNKEYIPGIIHPDSLRNLVYPLDWQGMVDYVSLPCVLKDAHGGGWKEVYICHSLDELIENYNHSGLLTMVVQEFIKITIRPTTNVIRAAHSDGPIHQLRIAQRKIDRVIGAKAGASGDKKRIRVQLGSKR